MCLCAEDSIVIVGIVCFGFYRECHLCLFRVKSVAPLISAYFTIHYHTFHIDLASVQHVLLHRAFQIVMTSVHNAVLRKNNGV